MITTILRLTRVELSRLVRRRAVQMLLLAAVLIPTAIGVGVVLNTQPPGADEIAWAEKQAAQENDAIATDCVRHPGRYGLEKGATEAECEDAFAISAEDYLPYSPLSLAQERSDGSGIAIVTIVSILMLLCGATFAGHDWASGSMSNQLLFEPRRILVWLAKAKVVVLFAAAVGVAVTTAYWSALRWVAASRDIAVPDGVFLDCLQSGWRGAALAAAVALGGFTLTMLLRSTVGALGILMAFALAGGLVLAAVGFTDRWNPGLSMIAIINNGASYWAEGTCPDGTVGCSVQKTLTLARGTAYLGSVLLAVCIASLASFQRRDVP